MGKILIKISPDGSDTEIKVEGVVGADCEELTKSLEAAIFEAGSVDKDHTPEYYLDEVNVVANKV